jgi:Helix-turn-helix domain
MAHGCQWSLKREADCRFYEVYALSPLSKGDELRGSNAIDIMHGHRNPQPDLSNLLNGKFRGFSIERLMMMLTAFGRDVEVVVRPAARSKKTSGIKFRREAA